LLKIRKSNLGDKLKQIHYVDNYHIDKVPCSAKPQSFGLLIPG